MKFFLAVLAGFCLSGASSFATNLGVNPVPELDVRAYMGKWFQIGDYPQVYEKNCKFCTTASYTLDEKAGIVNVENACRSTVASKPTVVKATAKQVPNKPAGQFTVKFFKIFPAPYWIIQLGPIVNGQYQWAVVSNGAKQSLYVLSRTPTMDDKTYQNILAFLKSQDFDLKKFQLTTQAGCPTASLLEPSQKAVKLLTRFSENPFTSSANDACPGSSSWVHAKCSLAVNLQAPCDTVKKEIIGRINGENGWYDPHNKGTYSLLDGSSLLLKIKRVTGDGKYTDLLNFQLASSGSDTCEAQACSESQTTSVLDYSTNYCNLHDLYCGTDAGCKFVYTDMKFTEKFNSCKQHDASNCLKV